MPRSFRGSNSPMQRGPLERRHTPFGLRGQELLVLAGDQGSGISLSPLTPPRCGEALVDGGAARLEDVEPHHRPAESLEVIVDVEGQSAVAPPSFGPAGAAAPGRGTGRATPRSRRRTPDRPARRSRSTSRSRGTAPGGGAEDGATRRCERGDPGRERSEIPSSSRRAEVANAMPQWTPRSN